MWLGSQVQVCGKIKVFCFDKTGTLTEDGLDIKGLQASQGTQFAHLLYMTLFDYDRFDPFVSDSKGLPATDSLLHAFGTCHSLARLMRRNVQPGEPDSDIIGDPLEILMFDMTGWHLHEPRVVPGQSRVGIANITTSHTVLIPTYHDQHRYVPTSELSVQPVIPKTPVLAGDHQATCFAMIRQFTFSSALQRMAVIVGATDGFAYQGPLFIYAKVSTYDHVFTVLMIYFTHDFHHTMEVLAHCTVGSP